MRPGRVNEEEEEEEEEEVEDVDAREGVAPYAVGSSSRGGRVNGMDLPEEIASATCLAYREEIGRSSSTRTGTGAGTGAGADAGTGAAVEGVEEEDIEACANADADASAEESCDGPDVSDSDEACCPEVGGEEVEEEEEDAW